VNERIIAPPAAFEADSEVTTNKARSGAAPASRSKERDNSVDVLRGIAIVLVVLGHANRGAVDDGLRSALDLRFLDFAIYSFHMPLFFYLGGYFTARSLAQQETSQFLKSRAVRIVWPYLLWSGIYFVAGQVMSLFTTVNKPVTLQDLTDVGWQPLSTLWFLYALLVMQLLATVSYKRGTMMLAICLMADAAYTLLVGVGSQSIVERVIVHAPFFFGGVMMAGWSRPPISSPSSPPMVATVCLLFVGGTTCFYAVGIRVPVQLVTVPLAVLGIVAAGSFSARASKHRSLSALVLAELGRASLAIYLLHTLFLALVPRLLRSATVDLTSTRLLFGTLVGLGLSYAACAVLKRMKLAGALGLH
jgi:fucose 4-O-acetylase-like acetyltransferase